MKDAHFAVLVGSGVALLAFAVGAALGSKSAVLLAAKNDPKFLAAVERERQLPA